MEAVSTMAKGFERERLLLEDIIRSIVDRPERVAVKPIISTQVCLFEIYVDPFDCRRVIGKRGRIANALRELLLCWQGKREGGGRFILEIIEPELMLETLEASEADRSLGTELVTRGPGKPMVVAKRGQVNLAKYREDTSEMEP